MCLIVGFQSNANIFNTRRKTYNKKASEMPNYFWTVQFIDFKLLNIKNIKIFAIILKSSV